MFNYDKLEKAISESGKSKAYLCRQLGRPRYYLRDVVNQKSGIPAEYQTILANELGVSVEWLNDKTDIKERPALNSEGSLSKSEKEIINLWRSFSPEEQDRVLKMLSALQE